jgi:hypothetical protein
MAVAIAFDIVLNEFCQFLENLIARLEWKTIIPSETFLISRLQLKSNEKKLRISKKLL